MRASPIALVVCSGLALLGQESQAKAFRLWMGGQEIGGATLETRQEGQAREIRSREWMALTRLGQEIRQEVQQTARKEGDGSLTFTWRVQLSTEPFEGRAQWSPREPGILVLQPLRGAQIRKEVPPGALLWPEDLEARLKAGARSRQPVHAVRFSFPLQQWGAVDLDCQGTAPLPGFPDLVRFKGQEKEGPVSLPVEVWISPTEGEVRHRTEVGGLELLTQRSGLPAPLAGASPTKGLFDRSLKKLSPHPFQPWLSELTLRAEGPPLELPEDAQQRRAPGNRWRLRQAALPTLAESSQAPVSGTGTPEEALFLASSPLVPHRDPAFEGLLHRLALPAGLSRWEIARRVNTFVFEWITDKDFTVGFASALEVCHTPRGDCTEHGVLAVALLRRLGVPARAVTGWVGLGDLFGLHFWVEVRLKDRWVPIDPTFDQAPASALRLKLGDSDLADMGSILWEGASADLSAITWIPEWEEPKPQQGDQITAPGGVRLRLPGGRWELKHGLLRLQGPRGGSWSLQAVPRPGEAQLRGAQRLAGARTLRLGWWQAGGRQLWLELGQGRWLQVQGISEAEAYALLDQLLVSEGPS